jgi:hypothetical protein
MVDSFSGLDGMSLQYYLGSPYSTLFYDLNMKLYAGGAPPPEYEWNALVKGIYIEDEQWDPETESYKTVLKNIHKWHEQDCMNEYLWWMPEYLDTDPYLLNPEDEHYCNMFPPGEKYIVAHIANHGNNTYMNLPVHLNVWRQIYDDILISGFEDHVFSDWVAIDGGGCVHPYPDGDTWTMSTTRVCSGDYSMHVSKTDSYMKGANDTLRNRYPLNTHGGDCAEVTFWFWVEGDWDEEPWKAYDYLQVFWIQKPHDGPEIRHGPLDVEVRTPIPGYDACGIPWHELDEEQVRTWSWSEQSDLMRITSGWPDTWGGDHDHPLCVNSGGPNAYRGADPYNYNDPVWSAGRIEIPDDWKCDQTFVEFHWKADCMEQNEGAYIDNVIISRVINQGELVYTAHEQVNLVPGEAKALRFTPPWDNCCGKMDHGKYWIEARVKTHSNFVADEEPMDDWLKDEIRIKCCHDVAVTDVEVWPHKQQSGEVSSHLIPTNVKFDITNCGPYNEEFDVTLDVFNMEYNDIFVDDVEGGNLGWDHFASSYRTGPDLWHITTSDASSPTHSWVVQESDAPFYDNDMANYLISPTLNFEGLKDAYVCFDAKWALEAGDYWVMGIYDPYSNFIISIGGNPSQYDWGKCSGQWLPEYDGHPVWVGPGNPGADYLIRGSDLIGPRYYQWCMNIKGIIEDLHVDAPDWLGIDMFGHKVEYQDVGDPCDMHPNMALAGVEYRAGIVFGFFSDKTGREAVWDEETKTGNKEKWSGLFIDDIFVVGVEDGEKKYSETFHLKLPGQGYTKTIETEYCTDDIWGDFEVDIRTNLDIDCNPANNWMDGYNHIYYIDWLDDVEDYTRYDEHPYEDGWTHMDLRQEGNSNWHIVDNIDPVEGNQYYWWCGNDDSGLYGELWNDCMVSPEFDLYSLIPREPWCDPAVQLVFRMCAHLAFGDTFYVEASNDSGRNWHILEQWDGEWQSNCWHDIVINIPLHMYTRGFMFRFRFESDDSEYPWLEPTIHKGILLDDIILQALKGQCCPETDPTIFFEDFESGLPGDWTTDDVDGDGFVWTDTNPGGRVPRAGSNCDGTFMVCDEDEWWTYYQDDWLYSPNIDCTGYTNTKLSFGSDFYSYSFYPTQLAEVFVNGNLVYSFSGGHDYAQTDIDISAYADNNPNVEIAFHFYTEEWSYYWIVDNVLVTGDPTEVECEYGDPLAWYFEDDAETGGNPLWSLVPDYGGDIWHTYNYPIYHDPVYGTFGDIVSPILEAAPDINYMPTSEPWVFPSFNYTWITECPGCNPGPVADNDPHFWVCEKHHKEPYDDGITVWPKCTYSYLNNMDNILISPELDLQGTYHAHLWFEYIGWLGEGDEFWIMVREKNDDGTWGPWNFMREIYPDAPNVQWFYGNTAEVGWNLMDQLDDYYRTPFYTSDYVHPIAASPGFMVNLLDYVRDQDIIQFGFRLISDEAGVGAGIKIDNIKLDVKRDDEAPVTTCDLSGTMGCNDWYTSEVSIRLSGTDDRVGIGETWYRIDGGAWQLYTGRFAVTDDGEHTVEYYSIDNVGNAEEIKTCEAFKIDQTPPTVALSMPESGYLYIGGRPIFQIGRTIVIGELTSQASASDATSGIDYVEFLVDGEVKSADLTAPFTFELPKGGLIPASHTLQVKAYDNACNAATGTQTTYLKWL